MNAPMVGTWPVIVRAVRPFTIHGDLYYELHVTRLDDSGAAAVPEQSYTLRVPQHAVGAAVPGVGDGVSVTFLMGQVTAVGPIAAP